MSIDMITPAMAAEYEKELEKLSRKSNKERMVAEIPENSLPLPSYQEYPFGLSPPVNS